MVKKYIDDLGEKTWSRVSTVECSKVMGVVSISIIYVDASLI